MPADVFHDGRTLYRAIARGKRIRRRKNFIIHTANMMFQQVHITAEVIGKGGFGTVYLADFNGLNAAAKVVVFGTDADMTSDDDYDDDNDKEEEEDAMQGSRTPGRMKSLLL